MELGRLGECFVAALMTYTINNRVHKVLWGVSVVLRPPLCAFVPSSLRTIVSSWMSYESPTIRPNPLSLRPSLREFARPAFSVPVYFVVVIAGLPHVFHVPCRSRIFALGRAQLPSATRTKKSVRHQFWTILTPNQRGCFWERGWIKEIYLWIIILS